jgi:hypothetical protein
MVTFQSQTLRSVAKRIRLMRCRSCAELPALVAVTVAAGVVFIRSGNSTCVDG